MLLELEGKSYKTGSLDAFTQLHVARKLGIAAELVGGMVREENRDKDLSMLVLLALSQIGDADSDYVVKKCLSVVHVQETTGWAPVASKGTITYDFITLGMMLKLTAAVVEENLGDFFRTALADLSAKAAPTSSSPQ